MVVIRGGAADISDLGGWWGRDGSSRDPTTHARGKPLIAAPILGAQHMEGVNIRRRLGSVAAVAASAVAFGCGGPAITDVPGFLAQAKATIDHTPSLHVALTSENARGTGVVLTGADADAKRPNSFAGALHVSAGGAPLTVSIVSISGTFYAELPFTTSYKVAKPQDFGFGDPAQLLDPDRGLSSLLTQAKNPQAGDTKRLNGEELQLITCTLPGDRIAALLTSADPSRDVQATFWINATSHETREVDLTGPFVAKDHNTTYHLVLTNYGQNVTVTTPPA
jgi:lipoprotein LprG